MALDLVWLGQGLAVDLVNTYVPAQKADLLESWPGLTEWGVDAANAIPLRELATEAIDLLIAQAAVPNRIRQQLNRASSGDPELVTLDASGARATRSGLAGALARDLIQLIADGAHLRRCPAPGCGMVYPQSRASQTWCSTSCGNRARVARHAAKRAASGA
jgi:predicted RNA-binding Zn ribbon-like protein